MASLLQTSLVWKLLPSCFADHGISSQSTLMTFVLAFPAENLGFTSYPPAYLSREARGKKLLSGANFASASSGYYDNTAKLFVNFFFLPRLLHSTI